MGVSDILNPGPRRHARTLGELLGFLLTDTAEVLLQEASELPCLGSLEHLNQCAKFDALGVGLDLFGFFGQFLDSSREQNRFIARRDVGDLGVRIGDGRLFKVFVDALAAFWYLPSSSMETIVP